MLRSANVPPRNWLADKIKSFHDLAQTNTAAVDGACDRLRAGGTIVRVFHQPNLFAALNIAGLMKLADSACESLESNLLIRPVSLFVVLDYDEAGDQRFRTPFLPAWSNVGLVRLSGAVPERLRKSLACTVATPNVDHVSDWMVKFELAVKGWGRLLRREDRAALSPADLGEGLEVTLEVHRALFSRHSSLTAANASALSWLSNVAWKLDTLFVPSSWLLEIGHKYLVELLRTPDNRMEKANEVCKQLADEMKVDYPYVGLNFRNRGAWRICPRCYRRNPLRIQLEGSRTVGSWQCTKCEVGGIDDVDRYETIPSPTGPVPRIVPTAIVCNLLEVLAYGLLVDIHYSGSVEHVFWSRVIGSVLGMPIPSDFFWYPANLVSSTPVDNALRSFGHEDNAMESTEVRNAFLKGQLPATFYSVLYHRDALARTIVASGEHEDSVNLGLF